MTNTEITRELQSMRGEIAELRKYTHPPEFVPTQAVVLDWIARAKYERQQRIRDNVKLTLIIGTAIVFFAWGVFSAVMEVVALWA